MNLRGRSSRRLLFKRAVRFETARGAERLDRLAQVFLPEQRSHPDIQGAVLNGQLVDVLVVGSVIVNGPAGRREHEITGFPVVFLALDHAVAAARRRSWIGPTGTVRPPSTITSRAA